MFGAYLKAIAAWAAIGVPSSCAYALLLRTRLAEGKAARVTLKGFLYFAELGVGLTLALAIISCGLIWLSKMDSPDKARRKGLLIGLLTPLMVLGFLHPFFLLGLGLLLSPFTVLSDAVFGTLSGIWLAVLYYSPSLLFAGSIGGYICGDLRWRALQSGRRA